MDFRLISLLLVSFGTTFLVTPVVRRVGTALGLLDHPHHRKLQSSSVPRTGGIGVLAGLAAGLATLAFLAGGLGVPFGRELVAILIGGALVHVVGILDDLWDVPAPVKLFAQAAAVGVVISNGVVIRELSFAPGATWSLGPFAVPLTVFFVLGFVNALNLVDGLDGLAGGIAAVGAFSLAVAGSLLGNVVLAALALPLLGAALGFLPHNFRTDRKTFLGDAGSMLLGYALAVTAIAGNRFAGGDVTPVLVAVASASIPILDTVTTIVRRSRNGQALFRPDSMHLHHRLVRFGLTPRRAVATLWCATLVASCQLLAYAVDGTRALLVASILSAALVTMWIRRTPRTPDSAENDPSFREILFYLLGAQDGATPRLRGDLAIVEILAGMARRPGSAVTAPVLSAPDSDIEAERSLPIPETIAASHPEPVGATVGHSLEEVAAASE